MNLYIIKYIKGPMLQKGKNEEPVKFCIISKTIEEALGEANIYGEEKEFGEIKSIEVSTTLTPID